MIQSKIDGIDYVKNIFDIEISELIKVRDKIDEEIWNIAESILNLTGKVVVTGVGKSGHIGRKIASTLASTGTYAIFMNSAEALHGDLGMVHPKDMVIAISNSGNSDEVVNILPSINKIGAKLVAITGNRNSRLGKAADYVLDIGVEREACPMNIAPTCSTTTTLVIGDALASLLITLRDFKPENFALYHPGGSLGRQLLTKVKDVMKTDIAIVRERDIIETVLMQLSEKKLGAVCVVEEDKIIGIITEGDVRRALSCRDKFFDFKAGDIMTKDFMYISENIQAMDALGMMENRESQISVLPSAGR